MRPFFVALVAWAASSGMIAEAASDLTSTPFRDSVFKATTMVDQAGPESAPVVVLIHGIGDKGARDWSTLMPRLAGEFRVITFDLPGFGRADRGNLPYTPDNYVTFVREVVNQFAKGMRTLMVGHSMGALIAMRYAARHPEDVPALVLADVPGILHRLAFSQYLSHLGLNSLPSLYPAQNDHLQNLASNFLGFIERAKPAPETILGSAQLRKNLLGANPSKIAGLALSVADFSSDIDAVRAPTLLLWGAKDHLAPMRTAQLLRSNLAHAKLIVLKSSGHTPMDDVPATFNTRVAEFLREPVFPAYPRLLDAKPPPVSKRTGKCRHQRGVRFEGDYDLIEVQSCRDVRIQNARVRRVRISNATVEIEDSVVGGPGGGLEVTDSRVSVTSTLIDAETAILADDARMNIAGCRIHGRRAAIDATRKSQAVFSVTRIESPHFKGRAHGLVTIPSDQPL